MLSTTEQFAFLSLIQLSSDAGYVLNFNNASFDNFTTKIVGFPIRQHYGQSKYKSLQKYIVDEIQEKRDELLFALFDYYELQGFHKITNDTLIYDDVEKARIEQENKKKQTLFNECKNIRNTYNIKTINTFNHIQQEWSSDYINRQVELMFSSIATHPTQTIGTAKELIESCCKTIFKRENRKIESNKNLSEQVSSVLEHLGIAPKQIPSHAKKSNSIKGIITGLTKSVQHLAELRNDYGSGHGKDASYKGLSERHAKLAVGCSSTIVNFLWDSYKRYQDTPF